LAAAITCSAGGIFFLIYKVLVPLKMHTRILRINKIMTPICQSIHYKVVKFAMPVKRRK